MKKRIVLSCMFIMYMVIMLSPYTVSANVVSISETEITNRINELNANLGGKYFNIGQNSACGTKAMGHGCQNCLTTNIVKQSWFKDTYGNITTNQFPYTYTSDVTISRAGYSCAGFASFAEWYIFRNSVSDTVNTTNLGTVTFNQTNMTTHARKGDLIRLEKTGGGSGHSVIFIGADASGIQVLDCNYSGTYNCKVQIHTIAYSAYGIATISRVDTNVTTYQEPLDLGNEFAAIILRTDIWKSIKNDNGNVVLWDEQANARYYWLFTRQSDGSYIIKSLFDGNVMDLYCALTENGTNVQTYHQHGEDNYAQKWYIYPSGNSYKIVPKASDQICLDVCAGGTENGTNIQIFECNGTVSQQFSIYKISHSALQSIKLISEYVTKMKVGESQTLNISFTPSTTRCNTVKWSSSDTAILSVDSNGNVTANKAGCAIVTCTSTFDSSISTSVMITVEEKNTTVEKDTTETVPEQTFPKDDEKEELKEKEDITNPEVGQNDSPIQVGSILIDQKNKCRVVVTCNVEGAMTVDYLSSTLGNVKSIKIPNIVTIAGNTYKVTGIADHAFRDKKSISKVTIGSNVKCIGDSAFRNCKRLNAIVIPKSVKIIEKKAFLNCKSLKKITIKGTRLTSVGKNAFKGISKKVKVSAPKAKVKKYKKMLKKAGLKIRK